MTELLTSAQMRAIEKAAIASGKVTGLELMERAGQGVVDAVFAEWPELSPAARRRGGAAPTPPEYLDQEKGGHRAVVLCGPGNNGGDGFVVARLLAELGWSVEVFLYGDAEKLPPDARVNYERWLAIGKVSFIDTEENWDKALAGLARYEDQLVVDALFGTGLTRAIDAPLASVLNSLDDTMDQVMGRYVAVDTPSGICADSGRVLGRACRRADLTVTFHRAKVGHFLDRGPHTCGRLDIVDIGLEEWAFSWKVDVNPAKASREALRAAGQENAARCPVQFTHGHMPAKAKQPGHKYSYGHALILAGPSGRGGAARLAARGALRIGAGLVTLAPTPDAVQENAARLDAIMLAPVGDAATLARVLEDARLNAVLLGPGLGLERARDLVPIALGDGGVKPRPTVLDADALTAFADDPDVLFAMLHPACVLTPHAGEFARLFPDIAETLAAPATKGPAYSKVDATREAAKRAGCTVLYKGPDTVIADPAGRASINAAAYDRAAPWLATAGSGDVLAGMVAGLLARGFEPKKAAETAAWLHVEAARSFGPGLIAEDLPEELPTVFAGLGL